MQPLPQDAALFWLPLTPFNNCDFHRRLNLKQLGVKIPVFDASIAVQKYFLFQIKTFECLLV